MSLAERIAVMIGKNAQNYLDVDDDNKEIIIYGAINVFQIIFSVLWVFILGFIFGVIEEAIIFSFTNAILRKYSGGVHASSPSRCIIIGTSIAVISGIIIDSELCRLNIYTVVLMSIFSLLSSLFIIIKNAPVDSHKKPIVNIQLRKQFKNKSINVIAVLSLVIMILFIIYMKYTNLYYIKVIESISLGVFWQAITLTRVGIYLLNKVDLILRCIFERR